MIDVDEVEARRFLAEADLSGAGLSDLDFFPLEDFGPSNFMDSDCVRHEAQMGAASGKEKPR
jgi:hypothetical protein